VDFEETSIALDPNNEASIFKEIMETTESDMRGLYKEIIQHHQR
jgi:hypothetical protein